MKISLEISCFRCVKMQSDSAQMNENRFIFTEILNSENKDLLRANSQSQFLLSVTNFR